MTEKGNNIAKKRLIIALIIILSTLLILLLITTLIPYISNIFTPEESEVIADFEFYAANYSEDIFTDEEYMQLIQNGILKYDNGSNSITTISFEDCKDSTEPYAIICKMLNSIIEGDSDKYNSYFSEKYFEKNSPKENFTSQKIYNATLKFFSAETVEENKSTYNQYVFQLKYYIYKNNGTFRKDIGEGYRTQYFVVTDRDGTLLIDNILYDKVK